MAWYDECENPKVMRGYYSAPPALDIWDLHEILLHHDGPLVRLRGDLPVFPDRPSKRWPQGANTAQVTLSLWGVSGVSIRDWKTTIEGTFSLDRLDQQRLSFSFRTDSVILCGECIYASIDKITGYIDGAKL